MGDSLGQMWDRYHVGEALVALGDGIVLAALIVGLSVMALRTGHRWVVPVARFVDARWLAVVGLVGAALGSAGSPRSLPWLIAAVVALVPADDGARAHPFGRWTGVLALGTLAGIWSAVPDTEPPLMAAMVLVPSALWWAHGDRAPGPAGTSALVVAAAGAVWVGSAGWGAALATVVAATGLVAAPVVVGWGERLTGRGLAVAASAHLIVALVVPRLVMRRSVPVAVAIAVGAALALVVVLLAVRKTLLSSSNWRGFPRS